MQKKHCIIANSILMAWFFLDMVGLYFGESYLVTRLWKEDGIFFLIFLFAFILFVFKEQVGKYILSIWLGVWLITQFFSHEWFTIVGGGEGKIRYFEHSIKWVAFDYRYIPDVYHTILHILILIALGTTLEYSEKFKKGIIGRSILIVVVFSLAAFIGVSIAHNQAFSRVDYADYDKNKFLTYNDIDSVLYPRDTLKIKSDEDVLTGYLYGADSTKGIIVISPGHREPNDIKLYEIMSFVDEGWMVLCYDYIGCYNSEGKNMAGYIQAPKNLKTVIDYVSTEAQFEDIPVFLFGHSLGAYASAVALRYNHNIMAVVVASGFDNPEEQWEYAVKKATGIFGTLLKPYAGMYMDIKFGNQAHLSAIDGINSTDTPVLIISGTDDDFYGGQSKIYERKNKIINQNCEFRLIDKEEHNGHYDYFLTDEALEYQKKVKHDDITEVDKLLYMAHDKEFMAYINNFYLKALEND